MSKTIKLAISSDHAGYEMKEALKGHFGSRIAWTDLGTDSKDSVNYADFGRAMGEAISSGAVARGVVICGTGIGISIAANRFRNVRAASCANSTMAALARQHNDANVLALGARVIGIQVAIDCVEAFIATEFEGGRHVARVESLG